MKLVPTVLALACCAALVACANINYIDKPTQPKSEPAASGKNYYRTLAPGEHALRKITDPAQLPDFGQALRDRTDLSKAVGHSINYLNKPSSHQFFPVSGITHSQARQSLLAFKELIDSSKTSEEVNAELKRRFDVYTSVGYDDEGSVLFTGYYTPIFEASLTPDATFKYPIYKLPPNHVKDEITGQTLGLRRPDGSINANYPSRRELTAGDMLEGLELAYFKDPVEAYIVTVQGSAMLDLKQGYRMEVGYAGTNGREYSSISLELVKRGHLRQDQISLDNVMAYFRQHPEAFEEMIDANERFIFFMESGGGPFGSLNEQVIALRSIATDKSIFPRGSICLVNAPLPTSGASAVQSSIFMCDQDTGGAIRAPGRCDIYWGVGDDAQGKAGKTYGEGRLYYLFLKESSTG